MSLMNDALRKKNREMTGSPAAPGFTEASRHSRTGKKWFIGLAATILLTAAALIGINLIQSPSGPSLLVKSPLPERNPPPENHPAHISSAVDRQSAGPAEQASRGGVQETKDSHAATADTTPANSHDSAAPDSSAAIGATADTRAGESAPALKPTHVQPVTEAIARAPQSIEAPASPSPRSAAGAVSRVSEPGPDQRVQGRITPPVVSRPPQPPVQPAASPASRPSTQSISERNAGATVRQSAQSDGEGDLFYDKARAYHRGGRLTDAIRLYRQFLESNSSHPGAMLNLAAAYMQQGNYVDAGPLLNRLQQSNPRPPGVLLNQAIAAIGIGAPDQALDYLDRAERWSDASPWEIRFHRAVAFARMNRHTEALALYREAESERPDDPRIQFNLAVTCDALSQYPEALAYYEAFLRTPPETSDTDPKTIIQRIRTIRRYLGSAQSPIKGQ